MTEQLYRVVDCPRNGSAGQDCGTYPLADLPARLRQAVEAAPDAGEWTLPALSRGGSGEELTDLDVVVTAIQPEAPCGP